ncbi:class I SAM-dependent methyltransferase [Corynebacterium anserum]|uniref:Methyltransferase domain-containing protein n=1 Tax=Corynebacterium anserum TaxID=2684406 RepID=A0A7G7YMA6_9CORY|nr:class I SAM-dependent methyltransferase [Corynebacterium anserum]MBC2680983.1 methyltransferase domain-containing protein [Corynebacterium anserum]QNH95626.1 methyltransferase domain-containing protein [Corynebacterium anserum]
MSQYIHGHDAAQKTHAARTAEDSAAFLLPHLDKHTILADIGCGPGSITLDLARHIESLGGLAEQVTGVDTASEAVSCANTAAARAHLPVTFVQASGTSLPFDDNSIDVAFLAQVLHHVPDPTAVLKECARVVKPGGIIASREVDYGAMLWYPPHPGLTRWRAIFSSVAALNGTQPNAGRHLPLWFRRASLTDTTVTSSNWVYSNKADCVQLATSWASRTQEEAYVLQAAHALGDVQEGTPGKPVAGDITHAAIKQIAEGWHEWANAPGALFMMPHIEVIARIPSDLDN